ncbi:spondin domain-containing protein [Dasania marina]|uniref:spondin domain-containing protein n=1 Tax=Dasania marina TaxID=471499 RepID=UPI00035D930F|nr:spondin domain-containing protein [Dasania marina]
MTITNITLGQSFTPQLVVTHAKTVHLFTLGQPASPALSILAESGNPAPLIEQLGTSANDAQVIPALLSPGQSATVTVKGHPNLGFLSVAAMMIPTNDNFVAVNKLRLPKRGSKTIMASFYDAGTEYNDQNCANIPGPRCGGIALSDPNPETDEGYVHISNGFHDLGDYDEAGNEILKPQHYDWRNSVAIVTVERVH